LIVNKYKATWNLASHNKNLDHISLACKAHNEQENENACNILKCIDKNCRNSHYHQAKDHAGLPAYVVRKKVNQNESAESSNVEQGWSDCIEVANKLDKIEWYYFSVQ